MRILLTFLCSILFYSTFGQSVIDLGNLEIEGEVRRPMINLFQNPKEMQDSYKSFAHKKVLGGLKDLERLHKAERSSQKDLIEAFEKELLRLK